MAGENSSRSLLERGQRIFRRRRSVLFGHEVDKLRPMGGAGRRLSINPVQREEAWKAAGAKIEKKPALAWHCGYGKTIGFQGFVHSGLVWAGVNALARDFEFDALLRMPWWGAAMQEEAGPNERRISPRG